MRGKRNFFSRCQYTKLGKSGQIQQIGVSNHNLTEIKRSNEILGAAGLKVSAVQSHYSLMNRSSQASGILDCRKENGIAFFANMVLGQGALSGKYDTAHPFPDDSDRGRTYYLEGSGKWETDCFG